MRCENNQDEKFILLIHNDIVIAFDFVRVLSIMLFTSLYKIDFVTNIDLFFIIIHSTYIFKYFTFI